MISIIIPVYNVKPYLRKCLDSVINQTYRELEILIVDDGSTDGSGEICDEYKKDERVIVFHTENRGLSCARNVGLDNAKGEWIGFVDSDDWIEPDMYEALLKKAEESGADVVECGFFMEYISQTIERSANLETVCGTEAIEALIKQKISNTVWNKLWKSQVFADIRFPAGRDFEDISTVYKLFRDARVVGINGAYYHWRKRASSISNYRGKKNAEDRWRAYKQRYDDLKDCVSGESKAMLLKNCAYAISVMWAWNLKNNCSSAILKEANEFVKEHYPFDDVQEIPVSMRVGLFLAQYNNRMSFMIAYLINQIRRFPRLITRDKQMSR